MKEVTEQDVQHVRELVASLLEAEDVNDEHDDKAQVLQQVQDGAAVRRFVRAAGYNHTGAAKRLVRGPGSACASCACRHAQDAAGQEGGQRQAREAVSGS